MPPKDINTSAVAAQVRAAQQLKETGDVTKAQIEANKQAAANQTTPELIPPTGNPSAVSAPVITNLRFEDLMRQRFEKEYAEEKRKEQERLQKERLGYGIAGLAATIGDMVRASEGAPVNPRDWQKIYDNLTAQEKANVNNYNVRMAKLREDARADRKGAAAAAAQAEAAKQQRDYEVVKDYIERNFKGDQAEKERMLKWLLGIEQNKARVDAAKARANGGSGSGTKYISTTAFGRAIKYPKHTEDSVMREVAGILNSLGVSLGIKNDVLDPQKQQALNIKVNQILNTKGEEVEDNKGNKTIVYKVPADLTNPDGLQTITLEPADIAKIQAVFDRAAALGGNEGGNGIYIPGITPEE